MILPPHLMHSLANSPAAIRRLKWLSTARAAQITPPGDWRVWLVLAGRGFGKTRLGAEDVAWYGATHPGAQIAVVAPTFNDVRGTCFEGVSGLLATVPPEMVAEYNKTRQELSLTNGALFRGFSADTPDRLRGPQFHRAWCFIAGTMVATDKDAVPIERLMPGDMVMTRRGPRVVAANASRLAPVGEIVFSDGRKLIGTADHPVYTAHGWVRMDQLAQGDFACAISVSNGAAFSGTDTTADIMSEPSKAGSRVSASGCIVQSGLASMAPFQAAWKCITGMATRATTIFATWKFSPSPITCATIGQGSDRQTMTGNPPMPGRGLARIAARLSSGREHMSLSASDASRNERMPTEQKSQPASIAGRNSKPFVATSALSVASTWRPVGERCVYCLKVFGEPEYFANGILVHNCDELAAWAYPDAWDQLQFGLRLGTDPRAVVTTTPRPTPLVRSLVKDPRTRITRGSTFDNAANLAPSALEALRERYEGTRLGRQELNAEILDDVPGALWTREMIRHSRDIPPMSRVVVAVDPSGAGGDGSGDNIGIVVAGRGIDGKFYALEDATCDLSPAGWGRRVVDRFKAHSADRIVAERNFGGAMVESVIRTADRNAPIKMVTASRGKSVRAEPVAALYEQGRVIHAHGMDLLEDQMMQMTLTGFVGEGSPDRVDALVWALTDLMDTPKAEFFVI